MVEEPDRIREDIEATRADLTRDVNRLADKTSPTRVARRSWDNVKERVRDVGDRVMGAPSGAAQSMGERAHSAQEGARDAMSSAADSARDAASSAADTVRGAPDALARKTKGSPVAAGLIAFGAGMLVASLLPETDVERHAGAQIREQAGDLVEPLKEKAQELGQEFSGTVREAAAEVKETAKDAAAQTADQAKSSARGAVDETKSAARSAANP